MSVPTSAEKLVKLVEFGILISSQKELDNLLDKVVDTVMELTGARVGAYYTVSNGSLRFATGKIHDNNQKRPFPEDSTRRIPFPAESQSLLGHCATAGASVNIADINQPVLHIPCQLDRNIDIPCTGTFLSMLLIPVIDQTRNTLGIIQLMDAVDDENMARGFNEDDIPIIESLASQSAVAIRNVVLSKEIRSAYYETIFRLSLAAEYRDKETANHIYRVSNYSAVIADCAGYSNHFRNLIQYSSPMHDVGKIGIPDSILFKPDKLTPEERTIMESHTIIGSRMFRGSDFEVLQMAEKVAECHHERYDGQGYPQRLQGEDIPVEGRIVAIADVFDALSSRRRYKESYPMNEVLKIMKQDSGTHFDPRLVDAFIIGLDEILDIKKRYSDPAP